jgi:hypothetical protein
MGLIKVSCSKYMTTKFYELRYNVDDLWLFVRAPTYYFFKYPHLMGLFESYDFFFHDRENKGSKRSCKKGH